MDLGDDQEEELLEGDDEKQRTAAEWTKHSSLLRTGAAGYKTSNRIAAEARATYGTGPCAATIRGAVARNLKSPPENPTRKSHSGCRVWWGRGMTTPCQAPGRQHTHRPHIHVCSQPPLLCFMCIGARVSRGASAAYTRRGGLAGPGAYNIQYATRARSTEDRGGELPKRDINPLRGLAKAKCAPVFVSGAWPGGRSTWGSFHNKSAGALIQPQRRSESRMLPLNSSPESPKMIFNGNIVRDVYR